VAIWLFYSILFSFPFSPFVCGMRRNEEDRVEEGQRWRFCCRVPRCRRAPCTSDDTDPSRCPVCASCSCVCVCVCVCMCVCVCVCVCMNVCMIHICTCICTCTRCACVCVHTHTHARTHYMIYITRVTQIAHALQFACCSRRVAPPMNACMRASAFRFPCVP
jgi:hypothetical protein